MVHKKLFKSAVIITASLLLFTACGDKVEPVSAEPTETASEVDTEESEESSESMEPVPSPTVEPTEEPVEESVENSESEVDTSEAEESSGEESPEESTSIEIVEELDLQMYVQTSANARSGDSTDFDVVTTFSINTELHVTGRTANDWYRVEQSNGDVYISGKLLSAEKAVVQQSTGGNNSSGEGSQPSGGGSSSSDDGGGAVAGDPAPGGGVWEDAGAMDWSGTSDWVWQ